MSLATGLLAPDIVGMFSAVFGQVVSTRAARSLPPLVGAHLGKEWVRFEESPPRIVVVPTRASFEYARMNGTLPPTGQVDATNPPIFASAWLHFEAHAWGEEDPNPPSTLTEASLWYSFRSTLELVREFLDALRFNLGNVTNPRSGNGVRIDTAEWRQPSDLNRLGRMLVVPFSIPTPVVSEPFTTQTITTIDVDTKAIFLDGTSSDQGTIIIS